MPTPTYIGGYGSSTPRLMVIAEAGGYEEEIAAQKGIKDCVLIGQTGKMVQSMVKKAGIDWGEVYRTNVVKCRPPDNNLKRLHEYGLSLTDGIAQLREEITALNPNAILALGNLSLRTLTGNDKVGKWRGSILHSLPEFGDKKVISTYHPAALFSKGNDEKGAIPWQAKYWIQHDIDRAVRESGSPDFNLPDRILDIARSSLDLFRFLQTYEGCREVNVDIEVIKCIIICVGIAFNKQHGMCVPLIDLPGWNGPSINERAEMLLMLAELLERDDILISGQNFKFDQDKIIKQLGIQCKDPYIDTELLAQVCYPEFPKSLAFLTSWATREPYYKDEYKEFNPKKDKIERVWTYNCKDVTVDMEVKEKLLQEARDMGLEDYFFNFMMPRHRLFMDIENRGFNINHDLRKHLIEKYADMYAEKIEFLNKLVGHEINVQSNPQVHKLLYERLNLPQRDGAGVDVLIALLGNNVKNDIQRWAIENILDQRAIKKALNLAKAPLDFDGRMRTNIKIDGTETNRRSDKNLRPPIRPYVPDELDPTIGRAIGIPFKIITKHGDFGSDIREMFIPDPGMVFGEADQSQAEARVVALLARDFEGLAEYDTIDRHRLTASWFFGKTDLQSITEDERFIGKTGRHLGHYDGQKHRLMQSINKGARRFHILDKDGRTLTVSEKQAGEILTIFHARDPKVRGVFHKEIREISEEQNQVLTTPFGFRRQFFGRPGPELDREKYAFIPQATIPDNTIRAMLNVQKRIQDIQYLLESHDAFLWQCYPSDFEKIANIVKEEMEREIDFSKGSLPRHPLSIPCEIKWGWNYKDMKKYKIGDKIEI